MNVTAEDTFYYSKLSQLGVEEWLPIKGFDFAYEVSNIGRVRSIPRTMSNPAGTNSGVSGRIMKGGLSRDRPMVTLRGAPGVAARLIHSMVAEAFIGPRPAGLVVCHGNGDPKDNRLFNLRYDTQFNNMQDAIKHGTASKLNADGTPKGKFNITLTEEEVQEILYVLATEDLTYKEAADKYDWSLGIVKGIGLGKTYQWIDEPEIPSHLPRYTRKRPLIYKDGLPWRSATSKLNADQIKDMREQAEVGTSLEQLASDSNTSLTNVRAITRGSYCSWAPGPLRKKRGQ